MTGIAARPSLRVFREHPALDGAQVTDQITEGELAGPVRPIDLLGRNAGDDPHRPLTNAIEIVDKLPHALIHERDSLTTSFDTTPPPNAPADGSTAIRRAHSWTPE